MLVRHNDVGLLISTSSPSQPARLFWVTDKAAKVGGEAEGRSLAVAQRLADECGAIVVVLELRRLCMILPVPWIWALDVGGKTVSHSWNRPSRPNYCIDNTVRTLWPENKRL